MIPVRDKIHVRPVEHIEENRNGIIIPITVKREKIECDVLAVGKRVTITSQGDKVYINPDTGVDLGNGTLIISEHEVRAIIPFNNITNDPLPDIPTELR